MTFRIKPVIHSMDTAEELFGAFKIGKDDLILTNEYVLMPHLGNSKPNCDMLFQEKFGSGEPSDEMIDGILQAANQKEYKRIFAIGGGTVIDIGKLLVFGPWYTCGDLFEKGATLPKKRELIAIPTTCGTGSEVTCISIAEIKAKHTKMGLSIEQLFPDQTVLIPGLLTTIPYNVFAASSIDALIHAIESYISPKANAFTRVFSEKAIGMILYGYQKLTYAGKTAEALQSMIGEFLTASCFAGIAFANAGVGAVHATSYPLGANFHIPHGNANYLMFGAVMEAYLKNGADLFDLEAVLSKTLQTKNVWEELKDLLDGILSRKPLREYGMTQNQIAEFADSVIKTQQRLLVNNPVAMPKGDIEEIYRTCF
jgi:4-hydroxybutyrate dehydrogenase